MTAITIAAENPLTPESQSLINGSEMAIREVYAPDECFTLSPDELDKSNIDFFVARKDGQPLGCVALVNYESYGEVKRLFVPTMGRGEGIAKILMQHLETRAKTTGLPCIRLETGPALQAAVALYTQRGYHIRGPFGDYEDHPASLFMEKPLK